MLTTATKSTKKKKQDGRNYFNIINRFSFAINMLISSNEMQCH